jgi:replicative DNA helicase
MSTNTGVERAILTAILRQGAELLIQIEESIGVDDFSQQHHKRLFGVLRHLVHNMQVKHFDVPTILATAETLGIQPLIAKGKDEVYLYSLTSTDVIPENVTAMVTMVRNLSIARQAHTAVTAIAADLKAAVGNDSAASILNSIENSLFDLKNRLSSQDNSLPLIGEGYAKLIEVLAANPGDMVGFPTGFQAYDRAIGGGLRPGTINIVGARPKQGKSILCLNIAKNLADAGIPVLYLDTELTREHQLMRLAALLTGVDLSRIETGQFGGNPLEHQAVVAAHQRIENLPFTHCSIAGQPVKSVSALIWRWLSRKARFNAAGKANPCAVIYDYLKLTDARALRGNVAEYQALGFLLTELHDFAMKHGVPIFATVQLNRDGEDREGGAVISGSDRILWLSSSFAILKPTIEKDLQHDPAQNGDCKLIVTDARFGPGMRHGEYLNLKTEFSRARIIEGQMFQGASRRSPISGKAVA